MCVCDTGILGVLSKGSSSPAGLWTRVSTMLGNSASLPQTPPAQGDAWVKANISPLLASETSQGFFLASQKAMANLLSPPREAV